MPQLFGCTLNFNWKFWINTLSKNIELCHWASHAGVCIHVEEIQLHKKRKRHRERFLLLSDSNLGFIMISRMVSFLSFFVVWFFIPSLGRRGQQQSVCMDFFIIRLDHRCVHATRAAITGSRRCRRNARLRATERLILSFQRFTLPVDNLGIFIVFIVFLTLCN